MSSAAYLRFTCHGVVLEGVAEDTETKRGHLSTVEMAGRQDNKSSVFIPWSVLK